MRTFEQDKSLLPFSCSSLKQSQAISTPVYACLCQANRLFLVSIVLHHLIPNNTFLERFQDSGKLMDICGHHAMKHGKLLRCTTKSQSGTHLDVYQAVTFFATVIVVAPGGAPEVLSLLNLRHHGLPGLA